MVEHRLHHVPKRFLYYFLVGMGLLLTATYVQAQFSYMELRTYTTSATDCTFSRYDNGASIANGTFSYSLDQLYLKLNITQISPSDSNLQLCIKSNMYSKRSVQVLLKYESTTHSYYVTAGMGSFIDEGDVSITLLIQPLESKVTYDVNLVVFHMRRPLDFFFIFLTIEIAGIIVMETIAWRYRKMKVQKQLRIYQDSWHATEIEKNALREVTVNLVLQEHNKLLQSLADHQPQKRGDPIA